MTRVRKCKDCGYSRPDNSLGYLIFFQRWGMAQCAHPSAEGERKDQLHRAYKGVVVETIERRLCYLHRQDFRGGAMDCGPEAKFFKPRLRCMQ